jgi:hypothetical protein
MRSMTKKRAAIEREYRKVQQQKLEEGCWCRGCGTTQKLSFSHRIPRSRRRDLIADPENIDLMCMDRCHHLVEAGEYDKLKNGEEIREYIERVDPEYYNIKTILKCDK